MKKKCRHRKSYYVGEVYGSTGLLYSSAEVHWCPNCGALKFWTSDHKRTVWKYPKDSLDWGDELTRAFGKAVQKAKKRDQKFEGIDGYG